MYRVCTRMRRVYVVEPGTYAYSYYTSGDTNGSHFSNGLIGSPVVPNVLRLWIVCVACWESKGGGEGRVSRCFCCLCSNACYLSMGCL